MTKLDLQELYDKCELKPGDEFICKDGESVCFVGKANKYKNNKDSFIFEAQNGIRRYYKNGRYYNGNKKCFFDIIRRATVKKELWINLYRDDEGSFRNSGFYKTKEQADNGAYPYRHSCHMITVED